MNQSCNQSSKSKKKKEKIEQNKEREKPAIGVEPMTIALQMRCSNL
jgi:hypothetical protein